MTQFIFFFLSLFSFYSISFAQVDPAIDWKVQEDDHAVWIYDSRLRVLMELYAKNFRRLFPEIQSVFHEVPDKTTFVISDYTDRPNGSATVFPYPMITIYPVIPLPNSAIGETDDSVYEILAHEYTHILNLYPVHGGMRGLSWIFGSIVRPNGYLPRWYAEGLAVFTESYFMPRGGRLRSQNFEGMVRSLALSKTWPHYSIDTLNDFEPDWLGGRRAYLLGGALMYQLALSKGLGTIDSLNQSYSRRIPYFINTPVEEKTGSDFAALLDETYNHLQQRADGQLKTLQSAPNTQGQLLQKQGFFSNRPSFSPDGQHLAFLTRDHNIPSSILLQDRDAQGTFVTGPSEQIAFGVEISDLSWSPDSQKIAYNSVETFKRFYEYSDIRIYDLKTKKTNKITSGARVGDLSFSTDGEKIYFVQNTPGSKQLSQVDLKKKVITLIYHPAKLTTNLYSLVQEGNDLFFIEQNQEKRSLKSVNLNSKEVSTHLDNFPVSSLRKSPRGILITSSQTGVENLYMVNTLKDIHQLPSPITNSLSRIMDGALDPKDGSLYYSEQTSQGQRLFHQSQESWQKITKAPTVSPLLPIPERAATTENPELSFSEKEKDFSPWPYLLPRYWMPFGYVIDGGMSFQASTGASDPLGKNSYNLMGEWDTLTQKTGVTASYMNTSTPFDLGVNASRVYRYNYSNKTTLRDTSGSVSAGYDLPFMFRKWNLNINWKWSETEFSSVTYRRAGPSATLAYSNAIQRGYEISPMSGISTSLSHQTFIESFGNIGYNKTNFNFKSYFSRWLPENNALFFQVNGVYAPELKSTASRPTANLYTSTLNGNYYNNLLIAPFLVRGYSSGSLIGYNMLAGNLEYRFPIARVYSGWQTVPFFIKRIHGALISDVVALDGGIYNKKAHGLVKERFGDHWLWGYGAELNIDCTIGYYLPATFSFGIYRGQNQNVALEDPSFFFVFKF